HLREVPAEGALEAIDPRYCDRRELRTVGAVESGRMAVKPPLDKLKPKARQDAPGRTAADDHEGPRGSRAKRDHHCKQLKRASDLSERRAVERPRSDVRE